MNLLDLVLSREKRMAAPLVTYPALKLLGANVNQALRDPEIHSEAAKLTLTEFGLDMMLPLMDLTVEAEAMGAGVRMTPTEAPTVVEHLSMEEALAIANLPDPERDARFPNFLRAAELMRSKCPKEIPLGFYLLGPFTLAGQLVGVTTLLKAVRRDPESVSQLVEMCTEVLARYADGLAQRGVDSLVMAEPTAGLISREDYIRFSGNPTAELTSRVPSQWILHICGRSGHLVDLMAQTGVVGVSLDQNVDLLEAAEKVPDEILLVGNYSPVKVAMESADVIRQEVRDLLERLSSIPNLIFSTGCDVPMRAPLENVKILAEVAHEFSQPS